MRRTRSALRATSMLGVAALSFALLSTLALPANAVGPNPNETVDTTVSATALAQSLVGPGVAISNVQFTGAAGSRGSFAFNDPTVVGVPGGVVLSSGNANDVVGPNTSDSNSTDWTNPGDGDLTTLSGFDTHDAAVLEFDFTPTANQVSFQYAFASDEYSEWVATPYNDVFGFFVNGVNYAEVRQVAGDPASPFVPVAVNNINNSNPVISPPPTPMRPDLFRANDYTGGTSAIDLELDGITRVLTFQAPVNTGVTNHMKLAIADASDGIYDSAVFIEAGSLVSNENPTADLGVLPTSGPAPLSLTATVEGKDPNGLPLTYSINWGDGTPNSTGALPGETALVDHTYLASGSFTITLTVSNGALSGTDTEDVHVLPGVGTYLTLSSAPSPSVVGQTVKLNALVVDSASPPSALTGTMRFYDGATLLGTKSVSHGKALLSTAKLVSAGDHPLTAVYERGVGYDPLTSPVRMQSVGQASTSVVVSSSKNPSTFTQKITIRARVKRLAPAAGTVTAGTVDFYDGSGLLAAGVTVTSGVASLTTGALAAGDHSITAAYSGSANDAASVSAGALAQHVDLAPTSIVLTASPNPSSSGQTVTLKVVVKRLAPATGHPSGTVDFYDGVNLIAANVPLSAAGTASWPTALLGVGDHSIAAYYSGSANDQPSHTQIVHHVN